MMGNADPRRIGCDVSDIVAAVGLQLDDLFPGAGGVQLPDRDLTVA